MSRPSRGSPSRGPLLAPLLVVAIAFSMQSGSALATRVIGSVGVVDALFLRTAIAALILIAVRPRSLRLPPRGQRATVAALALSLLGMNPKAAFPIMMGACAFLMPTASARFVAKQSYHPQASLGLALGGIPAVLVAAFIVKSLPIQTVRGMVIAVVVYTAYALLRSAWTERSPATEAAAQA